MSYLVDLQKALRIEAEAILSASKTLNKIHVDKTTKIFEMLIKNNGTLVISGVGKSALVGKKISATFASLGLRSIFLHPTEALHGDLGLLSKKDCIVLISKSGSTEELLKVVNYLPMDKDNVIGLFGNLEAPLNRYCGVVFDCSVKQEVCVNNLAPTTSTTVALAMGDALAVLYQKVTNLTEAEFAINHPAGYLGKSLLLTVGKLMVPLKNCATVSSKDSFQDAIVAMTQKPVGVCAVIDKKKLVGIIVEGDIRRTLAQKKFNPKEKIANIMNKNPVSVAPDKLVSHAVALMQNQGRRISILPVCVKDEFLGIIRMHDLLQEGFKFGQNN
jgi:arabinose-5-phosphate isomerase